jgi:hypothetical protein
MDKSAFVFLDKYWVDGHEVQFIRFWLQLEQEELQFLQ